MRISDWSSDVCSSDLLPLAVARGVNERARHAEGEHHAAAAEIADIIDRRNGLFPRPPDPMEDARQRDIIDVVPRRLRIGAALPPAGHAAGTELRLVSRSEERRVGKGGDSTGRS